MHPLTKFGWSDRVAALFSTAADGVPSAQPGRVVRADRGVHAVAVAPSGDVVPVRAAASLVEPPVTGDWAVIARDEFGDPWLAELLPRWSTLSRADPAEGLTSEQVLCANVDVLALVSALDRPVRPNTIERMLTVAWGSGAVPVVVLTKSDACDDVAAAAALAQSAAGGSDVVVTSALTGDGIDDLRALVTAGRTLALLGQSGAGKSSLVNALVGSEVRDTGAVRSGDAKGRHTTTSRELVALPGGGVLLDTPGIRSLGLWDAEGVSSSFADVEDLAAGCYFRDCGHDTEPGCAVLAAVVAGDLDARRLESYRKLLREVAAMEQRQDEAARRAASRRFGRAVRQHMKTNPKQGPRPR